MEYKFLLGLGILFLTIPFVLADTMQMYGGETKTIYSNDAISCSSVNVDVKANMILQNNDEGLREYNLTNCELTFESDLNDNWTCNCSGKSFNLILSILPNTINNYIFNLNFLNNEGISNGSSQIIINNRGGAGGICVTEWVCTEWSECMDNLQTRTCSYLDKFCKPQKEKPAEIQSCVSEKELEEEIITEEISKNFFGTITSAVIGNLGTGGTIGAFTFVLGIIVIIIFVRFRKRKN